MCPEFVLGVSARQICYRNQQVEETAERLRPIDRAENQLSLGWDRRAHFFIIASVSCDGTLPVKTTEFALDQKRVHRFERLPQQVAARQGFSGVQKIRQLA